MSVTPLRIGILGAGSIARKHMRGLRLVDHAKMVCVADADPDAAAQAAANFGVPETSNDYRAVIDRPDIDVIDVCLPTHLHADAVMRAAYAGKHVFCEKPMALNTADAQAMQMACSAAGVKLQLGFCRRFDNWWLAFKRLIETDEVGRPVVWRSAWASAGAPHDWFFQMETGGGPFVDTAVHWFDFARYLFGDAESVTAVVRNLQSSRSAPDTGIVSIQFASGDELQMMWSWGLPRGAQGNHLHDILGPKGAIHLSPAGNPPAEESTQNDETHGHVAVARPGGEVQWVGYPKNDMIRDELADFLRCIQEDDVPRATGEDGIRSLEICLAVLEAGRSGRPVTVGRVRRS